jgi:RNA polymerase sigma-70 factor (ECF subfamily)
MTDQHDVFSELAQKHLGALQSYCLAKTCDQDAALDLAQEALLRAYTRFHTLKEIDKFPAWLVGIAKRCSWNWFRKKKRDPLVQRDHETGNGPPPELPDENLNPEEHMQQMADWNETLQAVKRLRFIYREVIVLRYFEELSYSEMAARLGVKEDAVDQRLTRARRQLKQHLSHWEIDR